MNNSSAPLVSIVTPVYNTEKYLVECIESVLNQTYKNWEYIICDNCSTDESLKIAKSYAEKDDRIRVLENDTFLALMPNWNKAIRSISKESRYCKVVHADDWLFPECIAKMVEIAEANPSAGIVGSYRLDETEVNLDGLPYPSELTKGKEICRLFFLKHTFLFGSPSSLLYRSDIVHARGNMFYNEDNLHADQEVCFEILKERDFGFVHQVLTFTRRHNESTTSLVRSFGTYGLGDLLVLIKYGQDHLTPGEYKQVLKKEFNRYYRGLAKRFLLARDMKVLEYHNRELKKIGLSINNIRLIIGLFSTLYNSFLLRIRIMLF